MGYITSRLRRLWHDEGGWIQLALMGAGMLANMLSKGAKNAADGRAAQAALQGGQDRTLTDQYGINQQAEMAKGNLDLAQKNFTENARGNRAKQAMLADMLMNFQPTSIDVPGIPSAKVSGGLRMGEGGRAGASELMRQALLAQLSGDKFQGGNVLKAPGVQGIPQAGMLEKIGGYAGLVGGLAGAAGQMGLGGGGGVPSMGTNTGSPNLPTQGMDLSTPDNSNIPDLLARIAEINKRSVGGGLG